MTSSLQYRMRRLRRAMRSANDAVAARGVALLLRAIGRCDRRFASDRAAALMRILGPWLPEHRVGRANLVAAFPEKSAVEIDVILRGVWENLGRIGIEFAHLADICSGDPYHPNHLDYGPDEIARFVALRDAGRPALIFAAHLANWELPAVIAARHGLDAVVLYRRPNLAAFAETVIALRGNIMGEMLPSSISAPVALAHALEQGRHVAMLVDQHYSKGVEVMFFGRKCLANPLIAALARKLECPIHGTRVIRRPGHRFAVEITDALPPVRDADGLIDVAGTMQMIATVIEGWVREHPEQWLWLHRRWR